MVNIFVYRKLGEQIRSNMIATDYGHRGRGLQDFGAGIVFVSFQTIYGAYYYFDPDFSRLPVQYAGHIFTDFVIIVSGKPFGVHLAAAFFQSLISVFRRPFWLSLSHLSVLLGFGLYFFGRLLDLCCAFIAGFVEQLVKQSRLIGHGCLSRQPVAFAAI